MSKPGTLCKIHCGKQNLKTDGHSYHWPPLWSAIRPRGPVFLSGTSFANNAQSSTFSGHNIRGCRVLEKRQSIWIDGNLKLGKNTVTLGWTKWYTCTENGTKSTHSTSTGLQHFSSGRPFWILSGRLVQMKFNMTSNSGRQAFLVISDGKSPCHGNDFVL